MSKTFWIVLITLAFVGYVLSLSFRGTNIGTIGKLAKSIGFSVFTFVCAIVALYLLGGKGQKTITTVAAFSILTELSVIWGRGEKAKKDDDVSNHNLKIRKLKIRCPECGRSLKGATEEMIGDIGVCPKCKAEFTIEQKSGWPYRIGRRIGRFGL